MDVPPLLVEEGVGGGDSEEGLPPRSNPSPDHERGDGVRSLKGGEEPASKETDAEPEEIPELGIKTAVISSDAAKETTVSYPAMIAALFVGASTSAVYFIRRSKRVFKAGDDFKILDE